MIVLGIETSCDETAAAVVEETGDRARPWRDPLERRRVAGRRSIASGAASCRSWRRGSTSATSAASSSARSPTPASPADRRDRGDAGARAGRIAARRACRSRRRWRGRAACPLVPVHHLAGHIESLVLERGEMPLPAVVLVVSGGHTSLYRVTDARRVRAARTHARRCGGRGVRQGGQAAAARLSGRSGRSTVSRAAATTARSRFPRTRLTHADRNAPRSAGHARLQLQRAEDGGAAPRDGAPGGAGPGADEPLPEREIADICASFQRVVVETLLDRLFDAARWFRRAASASPAACRPTAACAPTRERRGRRDGHAGVRARVWRSRPTMPR